jgi:hypothetical protein
MCLNIFEELTANNFTVEKILSNIMYYRCVDHVQLISVVNGLKEVIEKHDNVSQSYYILIYLVEPRGFVFFCKSRSVAPVQVTVTQN